MGTIGIPVKLIHEAVGHVITVELKGGASYRGTLYDGMSLAILFASPRHSMAMLSDRFADPSLPCFPDMVDGDDMMRIAEDNFNVAMKDITVTAPDGKQSHLENVYIRGNMLRFIIVPDMLQQAPMFKRIGPNAMKGRGIGSARGRATILRGKFLSPHLLPS